MQKFLYENDVLMYWTYDEGKSVVVLRFIRTLKGKIHKKWIFNDNKSYLNYSNKLAVEYSNTYHCSIDKKPDDIYFIL